MKQKTDGTKSTDGKTVWDYINMISSSKIMPDFDDEFNKVYNPFLVNRFFSLTCEANIVIINEINKMPALGKKEHFLFLHKIIPKSKRRNVWPKKKKDEKIEFLMEAFQCSYEKARSFSDLITDEQIEKINASTYKGGVDVTKKKMRK